MSKLKLSLSSHPLPDAIERHAAALYATKGKAAVESFARKQHIPFGRCVSCGDEEPIWRGHCLICGTPYKGPKLSQSSDSDTQMNRKLVVHLESTSATNEYLSEDGLLNFSKIQTLQNRIAKFIKDSAKSDNPAKVLGVYVMKRRAKPVGYRASAKPTDLKYRAGRAIKIAFRKRLSPEALGKVAIVLQVVDSPKFAAALKAAQSAIKQHMTRSEKHVAKISNEKAKMREIANENFNESLKLLDDILDAAGFPESRRVDAVGMMGSARILKLDADHYVTITKADKSRFTAAVRASKEK